MLKADLTMAHVDACAPATMPACTGRLFIAMVIYATVAAVWMVAGFGGEQVMHYVGLLADLPVCLAATIITAAAARRAPPGAVQHAWRCMTLALALYLIGSVIATASWLRGIDPYPGFADIFFAGFYLPLFIGIALLIRTAALRLPWLRLALDGTIFVVGFGAFFWFLVIRPAAEAAEVGLLKQVLSQAYLASNCLLLLALGVLQLVGVGNAGGRRIPLLLTAGYATMFIADIMWALGKVGGSYLPGGLQDVIYVVCYLPLAAAACEQLRGRSTQALVQESRVDLLPQSLPYAAMLAAFAVLVYFARGDLGGAAALMTIIVFALMLLLMVRQGITLREDAAGREQRATRLVEARYASLIANASDVIMIVAPDGGLRFASAACQRTFGLEPLDIHGRNLLDLWTGDDREQLRAFLAEVVVSASGVVGPVELRLERGTGRQTLEIVGSNLTADPAVEGLALNFRDISDRKALEEQLRQLAFHDPLTLLANRNLFRDRVQHALTLAQRGKHHIAVMFLDLDNFKNINDSLGHEAGDHLLRAVAQRLIQATRSGDTVARLGGDEFAILVEGVAQKAGVEYVAAVVIESLGAPFTIAEAQVRVAASLGVALSGPDDAADALLSNADLAMYKAKAAGKGSYVVFEPQMQQALRERVQLEADISRALKAREFFLEYQPIIDLGTRSLLGVEALVRWRHPQYGVLQPARFIQAAEDSGQIIELGRWVLLEACQELHRWRASVAGGSGLRVSVNISGRHLQHGNLIQDVQRAVRMSELEPGNLVIELTESTIMHNTDVNLERLQRLKALGVRLAIDDFGTGYSSLSYLHRFPIDILKIDRSFVGRLTSDDDGPELARAVVSLGETMGLDTVAEGIELEEQVEALLALGCVAGQGFLFARAASLAQLSASPFVARRNELWSAQAANEKSSATGRFPALKIAGRRTAG
jgi:diguanylate cyclase (GGDEF)-like protein/PAS domain S-box-containing protein